MLLPYLVNTPKPSSRGMARTIVYSIEEDCWLFVAGHGENAAKLASLEALWDDRISCWRPSDKVRVPYTSQTPPYSNAMSKSLTLLRALNKNLSAKAKTLEDENKMLKEQLALAKAQPPEQYEHVEIEQDQEEKEEEEKEEAGSKENSKEAEKEMKEKEEKKRWKEMGEGGGFDQESPGFLAGEGGGGGQPDRLASRSRLARRRVRRKRRSQSLSMCGTLHNWPSPSRRRRTKRGGG